MGYSHGILAIEANGDGVFDLKLSGCRPNISPDGKKVCWGHGDYCAGVAELDFSGRRRRPSIIMDVVESKNPVETYHVTWSPDMKYLTFIARPPAQGQEHQGAAGRVPRRQRPRLERLRRRCQETQSLGRHHHRRQIVQAAVLGCRRSRAARSAREEGMTTPLWHDAPRRVGPFSPRRIVFFMLLALVVAGCGGGGNGEEGKGNGSDKVPDDDKIDMVLIPAGHFNMGSRTGQDDEKPVHKVWIDAFMMDRTEVTQADFERIAKEIPLPNPPISRGQPPVEQVKWT